jgi:drug/metabolite transporter (DMT)-like permease
VPTAATSDDRRAGIALCLISACGFGLMAIFAKQAYREGLGVTALLAARFVLAAAVFWAILGVRRLARGRRPAHAAKTPLGEGAAPPGDGFAAPREGAAPPREGAAPPREREGSAPGPRERAPRRVVLAALALGAVGYSAQAGFFFSALRHIDASLTSLLLYTFPALVCAGAVALGRERFTPAKAMALGLASGGTALVLLGGGTGGLQTTGVLLGLAAGVTYSAYILCAESIVTRIDPWLFGALVATGAALTLLATGAATGSLSLGGAGHGAWIWIVAIALLSTVVPVIAFLLGLQRVGAPTASIVSTMEPVITVSLAIALFHESFGPAQALGAVLVLAAVLALQSRRAEPAAGVARAAQPPAVASAGAAS